ncbi:MAG TPA: hypothetical protein VFD17_04905, partial [Clostridia bacterium]|nr:hypothetical protein [Clostridia bacterium]
MRKFIRSSFIFLLVLIYLLSCSIFVVADTQNRKELKSVFKSVLPSFNTYVYKGDDIGIIKHLNTLSVDEETAFSAVNSFGPTDSQQSIGQSDCEIFNTKNIAVGDELTIDYFLPNPQFTYEYQLVNNNIKYQYIFTFKEIASGQYKSTFFSPDGSEDYGLYRVSGNEIEEYETGFSIPYSEYGASNVIQGKNIVFKQVAPGTGWVNEYRKKDSWGNISEYLCTYTFLGFSMETILGRQVQVAKIACSYECEVIYESEFAEWVVVPSMASGEKWYAKGVGLVKDKGTSVSFWNNETYTSRRETSIVGYIGSGDPFISDSSIHIDKTDLILTKGKTATLTAVTNPEGIPVKWSSSDNNVAT